MGKATNSLSLKGHFLVAMPHMDDPNFAKAVIFLFEHSADGAMGFVVNKNCPGIDLPSMMTQLNIEMSADAIKSKAVRLGGPCSTDHGFVLHRSDTDMPGSQSNKQGHSLTNSIEALRHIASGAMTDDYIVSLGFSGWGPGQLEDELQENIWLCVDGDDRLLFHHDLDALWQMALAKLGATPSQLSQFSGQA